MKIEAIVASAGIGKRIGSFVRKPYLSISGRPILVRTLQTIGDSNKIDAIIAVVNRLDVKKCERLVKRYKLKKIKAVIAGGEERSDSVRNGLCALDIDTDIILVHDGVRPFITEDIIGRSVDCAIRYGACIVGVPVKATVKSVFGRQRSVLSKTYIVSKTLDRNKIWEIQTPQVFRKNIILKAYRKYGHLAVTDDSMLAEKMGVNVRVIMGSYRNIKITTPEDIIIGEAILKMENKVFRG